MANIGNNTLIGMYIPLNKLDDAIGGLVHICSREIKGLRDRKWSISIRPPKLHHWEYSTIHSS